MIPAILGAMINGACQPLLGVVFAKLIGLLSAPLEYLDIMYGKDYL
jgi:hypothetical protein